MPAFTSVRPKRPEVGPIRKSAHSASTRPPATAWPFTAATSGRASSYQPANSAFVSRASCASSRSGSAGTARRSAPPEKNLPLPVSTIAPGTAARTRSIAASSSRSRSGANAFAGGRFIATTATSPRSEKSTSAMASGLPNVP